MRNAKLKKLPLGAVSPAGWLQAQLRAQAEGLTGNVDKLFADLGDNSAWLGGTGESWERGPYYVDGLMPLAYLLDDQNLKNKALKWIDSILNSQNEEGFFGPKGNLDWWPRMVVTKMLPSYFEASQDGRVVPFLTKYYAYMLKNIDSRPLYSWANARGMEELIGIGWLHEQTGEEFLLTLGQKIIAQSMDWTGIFADFPYTKSSAQYMKSSVFNVRKVLFYGIDYINNLLGKTAMPIAKMQKRNNAEYNMFYHLTHGVNLAMAFKYPALSAAFTNKEGGGEEKTGYETVFRHHGTASGLYSCDEHLNGSEPTKGLELCTVAEAMFSCEKLYMLTDDGYWADLLELLAFNTFPATFTPDMCAHQYVQQTNQISATTAKRGWYDSYNKANIFGLKPNYACCLSNMHQGFPKLCEHLAFVRGEELALLCPVPMKLCAEVGKSQVELEIISDYPFKPTATINVIKGELNIAIRIPKNARSLSIDGKKYLGGEAKIFAKSGDKLNLEYDFYVLQKENPDGSSSYYWGNLLLALPITPNVKMKKGGRFADREMTPKTEWRFAPDITDGVKITENTIGKLPFENPPLIFETKGNRVLGWKEEKNSVGDSSCIYPKGEAVPMTLVPYGATRLRIAQFPRVR